MATAGSSRQGIVSIKSSKPMAGAAGHGSTNYDGIHLVHQRKANYMVQRGDSGAPVISQSNTNLAVGLQSGRDSLYIAYYSHIEWVTSLLTV